MASVERDLQDGGTGELEECREDSKAQRERAAVRVGEPWPGDLEFAAAIVRAKAVMVTYLGALFGAVLFLLSLHAMFVGDEDLLSECLSTVKVGLLGVFAWAVGPRFFQVISRLRLLPDVEDESKE